MAPNTVITDSISIFSDHSKEQKAGKEVKEILYKGHYYNVTDFIDRHPGGNIIKFYTEPGEDATQAIDQFHYRSRKWVEGIMKTFKKRPANPNERELEIKALPRHEALTADFNKLFEELKAEGYFEPSARHLIIRILEVSALFLLTFGIFFRCETMLAKCLATIACGFAMSRFGWLMHEGGHNSLTRSPKINKLIQDFSMCFALGGSSAWWNSQHNRHHAMPQRLEHDVDLSTLPFVAFHKRVVKDRKDINTFFIRYQTIFYWTIDLLLANIAWRYFLHPRYQVHKKAYREMIFAIPNIFFIVFAVGIHWYILMQYWHGFFLGVNFALSHSHLDVADKPTHWIEYSLTHTANITPSLFVDYFMGYLNYQIEHHLFPTMPQFRQREICHRVKALAEKHGLPYRVYSYTEACGLVLKNLNDVGRELTTNEILDDANIKSES